MVIPVGLHYDCKHRFRSSVLIHFHPPLTLSETLFHGTDDKEIWRGVTDAMEEALERVVFATESWEMHRNLHRASLLIRAERLSHKGRINTHL